MSLEMSDEAIRSSHVPRHVMPDSGRPLLSGEIASMKLRLKVADQVRRFADLLPHMTPHELKRVQDAIRAEIQRRVETDERFCEEWNA